LRFVEGLSLGVYRRVEFDVEVGGDGRREGDSGGLGFPTEDFCCKAKSEIRAPMP
jgi:hypothetical protein